MIFRSTDKSIGLIGTVIKDRERYEVGVINEVYSDKSGIPEFVVISNVKQVNRLEENYIVPASIIELNNIVSNYKVAQVNLLKSEIANAPQADIAGDIQDHEIEAIKNYFDRCINSKKRSVGQAKEFPFFRLSPNKKLSF